MLCREIIVVCSVINSKNLSRVCEQNLEILNVKLAVYLLHWILNIILFSRWYNIPIRHVCVRYYKRL